MIPPSNDGNQLVTMRLLRRFAADERGTYLIVAALVMPAVIGAAALGTEASFWYYKHRNMQSAADSGAVSAATSGSNISGEANAVTASYGYVNGLNSTVVTVNRPPSSGNYSSSAQAVEVVITQSQTRMLSGLFGSGTVPITARAVAIPNSGTGCVLALNTTASPGITTGGGAQLNAVNCNVNSNSGASPSLNVSNNASIKANQVSVVGDISGANNITATNGVRSHTGPVSDPYANTSPPSKPSCSNAKITVNANGKNTSLSPGCYGGSITVNAGATLNLDPGVYYFDGASLNVAGNATITGTGVTLVFTGSGSNWGTATIGSNATVNLVAPTSGPMTGIVLYGDRSMPSGTAFNLTGGANQYFGGAIYLPKANLSFTGGNSGSAGCTKVIADTITFTGGSTLQVNCSGMGTANIGVSTAQLVE